MERNPDTYAMLLYAVINCDHLEEVGLPGLQPFAPELRKIRDTPNLVRDAQIGLSMWQRSLRMRDFSCQVGPVTVDASTQTDFCMDDDFLQYPLVDPTTQNVNYDSTPDAAFQGRRYHSVFPRSRSPHHSSLSPGTSMGRESYNTRPNRGYNSQYDAGTSTCTRPAVHASSSTDNRPFRNAAASTVTREYRDSNFDPNNQPSTSRYE